MTSPRRPRRSYGLGLATAMSFALLPVAGCGPSLKQISAFGDATSVIAAGAEKGFRDANTTTVDRVLRELAKDSGGNPTEAHFAGVIPAKDLEVRLKLVAALQSYAAALKKLAEADFKEEIGQAARDLNGALAGLSSTYQTVSKSQKELISASDVALISTIVYAVGTSIHDTKKHNAIKKVIDKAHLAIVDAAKLLREELGKEGALSNLVIINLDGAVTAIDDQYADLLEDQHEAGTADEESSIQSRLKLLEQYRTALEQKMAAKAFFDAFDQAIEELSKTHKTLKEAKKLDADSVVKAVGELVDRAKAVKEFRD